MKSNEAKEIGLPPASGFVGPRSEEANRLYTEIAAKLMIDLATINGPSDPNHLAIVALVHEKMTGDCRACKGRGVMWRRAYGEGEWQETCARCNGTGVEPC